MKLREQVCRESCRYTEKNSQGWLPLEKQSVSVAATHALSDFLNLSALLLQEV